MKTFAAILLLAVSANASSCPYKRNDAKKDCPTGSNDPYKLKDSSKDKCQCQCKWSDSNNKCKEGQEFYKNSYKKYTGSGKGKNKAKRQECGCEWLPCAETCAALNPLGAATDADYKQKGRKDGCVCEPLDWAEACNYDMYKLLFPADAEGNECKEPVPEPEEVPDSAAYLTTAALAIVTAMLF